MQGRFKYHGSEIEFAVVGDVGSKKFFLRLTCEGRPEFKLELDQRNRVELERFFEPEGGKEFFQHFVRNYGFK